jgi:ribosomal protein S18 acetylase RimI-like enzyme
MPILYRPARAEELQTAEELVVRSINDLTVRHGFGSMASLRPPDFQLFSRKDDPDGLWVAESDGEIVGFAFSWVSGDLWFLAELFVSPTLQGRGIGNALLARAFAHAEEKGARNKALITFTFNTVSQGLYIRHGIFPRLPIYFLSGSRDALMAHRYGEELQHKTIDDTPADQESLARLDASALGISRAKHHRFLRGDAAMKGVLFYAEGECIGYAYVNSGGHIGPLAVARQEAMSAAFATALSLAAETGAAQLSAFLPGVNERALGIATTRGMRITFPMVLASARDFGDWTRYLPRNPGFM